MPDCWGGRHICKCTKGATTSTTTTSLTAQLRLRQLQYARQQFCVVGPAAVVVLVQETAEGIRKSLDGARVLGQAAEPASWLVSCHSPTHLLPLDLKMHSSVCSCCLLLFVLFVFAFAALNVPNAIAATHLIPTAHIRCLLLFEAFVAYLAIFLAAV